MTGQTEVSGERPQAKGRSSHQKLEEVREGLPWEPQQEAANTLTPPQGGWFCTC